MRSEDLTVTQSGNYYCIVDDLDLIIVILVSSMDLILIWITVLVLPVSAAAVLRR